ncbi:hypothetical protein [Lacticaseibacillus sp. GG6-2]
MARLSELVKLRETTYLTIQGVKVPAMFTFDSINAIESAYGQGYKKFERDLNAMMKYHTINIRDKKVQHLVWSLVYGLLIGGGTECTYQEMNLAVPFSQIPQVIKEAMDILNAQDFQLDDIKK